MSSRLKSARYGATLRKKYAEIESKMKQKYKCPKCFSLSIKRVSVGIWKCRKCDHTFTGGAYAPFTRPQT